MHDAADRCPGAAPPKARGVALAALLAVLPMESIAQVIVTPRHPTDDDTFKTAEGRTIRMYGIDAPEISQCCKDGWGGGGFEARQYLSKLIAGKELRCEDKGRDQYGRWIAQCFEGEIDLGREMVREGYAWAFVKYSKTYVAEEQQARQEKLGVHAHGCRPAWEWRMLEKMGLGLEER